MQGGVRWGGVAVFLQDVGPNLVNFYLLEFI